MPVEEFGPDHHFLPKEEVLSFEEIEKLARIFVTLGVGKIRLTGGEPLMRRELEVLIGKLAKIAGLRDLAMTTNGALLEDKAEALAKAGLKRITVSLDALDGEVFSRMNGTGAKIGRVMGGIEKAMSSGMGVKINTVVQRGVNEDQVLPLARWAKARGLALRFIEFMDVGETNRWKVGEVVSGGQILEALRGEFSLEEVEPAYRGEVAKRWRHADGSAEVGLITSVSEPFCTDCQRVRVSAEGRMFTCLFASSGHDLKGMLRSGMDERYVSQVIRSIWGERSDRYSEIRGKVVQPKAEMSYLGG